MHDLILLIITTAILSSQSSPIGYSNVAGSPYTVSWDSRSFLINGERVLLQGGSVHYPRVSLDEWSYTLQQMREDGLNHVEMYVFWNVHEPVAPQNGTHSFLALDGTRFDFVEFVRVAGRAGLFVNLRIGPYVCAEWAFGGLPLWLAEERGLCVRSICGKKEGVCEPWKGEDYQGGCDPWRLAMYNFVQYVVDSVKSASLLASQGGPIILTQLENEYGNYSPNGHKYIEWIGELGKSLDLGLPILMCNGLSAPGTVNTCNGDDCAEDYIPNHSSLYPDQPLVWTENEEWFQTWGGSYANDRRTAEELAYAVAKWVGLGGAHHNYYMWAGGNHVGPFAAAAMTNKYADGATLDSIGAPNQPKKNHLARLHKVLSSLTDQLFQKSKDELQPSPAPLCDGGEGKTQQVEFSPSLVFFLRTDSGEDSECVLSNETKFFLRPKSVVIFNPSSGEVLFDSHDVQEATSRPALLQSFPLPLSSWSMSSVNLSRSAYGEEEGERPKDQVRLVGMNSDYVTYSTTLPCYVKKTLSVGEEEVCRLVEEGGAVLKIESREAQVFQVYLDGKYVGRQANMNKGSDKWVASFQLPSFENEEGIQVGGEGEEEEGEEEEEEREEEEEEEREVGGLQLEEEKLGLLDILSISLGLDCLVSYQTPIEDEKVLQKGIVGKVWVEGGGEQERRRMDLSRGVWKHKKGLEGEEDFLYVTDAFAALKNLKNAPKTAIKTPKEARKYSNFPVFLKNDFEFEASSFPSFLVWNIKKMKFSEIAGGRLWVNGVDLGRWMSSRKGEEYMQHLYLIPSDVLRDKGTNSIVVLSENGEWGGGEFFLEEWGIEKKEEKIEIEIV